MPPRYALRLEDLRSWHVVTAVCGACDRRGRLNPLLLQGVRSGYTRLIDLERRLRCRSCGNRTGNHLLVAFTARE